MEYKDLSKKMKVVSCMFLPTLQEIRRVDHWNVCGFLGVFCEQNIENVVLKVKINMKDLYIDYRYI